MTLTDRVSSSTSASWTPRSWAVTRNRPSRGQAEHPPADLQAGPSATADSMEVGDGSGGGLAFGLEQTVSHGIISARAGPLAPPLRRFPSDRRAHQPATWRALVDLQGASSASTPLHVPQWRSEGIGFAIPSNLARKVYSELARRAMSPVAGWACRSRTWTRLWPGTSALDKDARAWSWADVMGERPGARSRPQDGRRALRYDGKAWMRCRELQRLVAEKRGQQGGSSRSGATRRPRRALKVADMSDFDGESAKTGAPPDRLLPSWACKCAPLALMRCGAPPDRGVVVEAVGRRLSSVGARGCKRRYHPGAGEGPHHIANDWPA